MPERIQRRRTKGWRMPPNTIYVGRGTKYGNPWDDAAVYEAAVLQARKRHPEAFRAWIAPLRGKNLACWCSVDKPCHADVLLRMANEELEPPMNADEAGRRE